MLHGAPDDSIPRGVQGDCKLQFPGMCCDACFGSCRFRSWDLASRVRSDYWVGERPCVCLRPVVAGHSPNYATFVDTSWRPQLVAITGQPFIHCTQQLTLYLRLLVMHSSMLSVGLAIYLLLYNCSCLLLLCVDACVYSACICTCGHEHGMCSYVPWGCVGHSCS